MYNKDYEKKRTPLPYQLFYLINNPRENLTNYLIIFTHNNVLSY